MRKNKQNTGQVMLVTVLLLGGAVMSAASLLGFLIVYKMRQTTDIGESAKALYAAEAGSEWELYQALKLGARLGSGGCPQFKNKAGFKTIVGLSEDGKSLNILSIGKSSKNIRAIMRNNVPVNDQTPTSTYPVWPTEQISANCSP